MRAVDIIMKKRDKMELSREEIHFMVSGYVNKTIPEYQIAAWLMAIYLNGMTFQETGYLTREMIESGEVFDLAEIDGSLVDKHSTGGVGDKVSMILAPIAAACGAKVPMMSGRALGHTGGTLDKLDSVPGYSTALTIEQFKKGLKNTGFAMTGQSEKVVPADRLMYALRDVIGTVESIPLITASIMSKKFAEGAEALVFDVKCGKGAFMKTQEEAEALAVSLVETGKSLGRNIVAVITTMDEPLGSMVGNFLEMEESVECLKGNGSDDLMDVTYRLTGWMLVAGGICKTIEEAEALCREKVANGEALEKFYQNIADQGGDVEKFKSQLGNARSKYSVELKSWKDGIVQGIDAFTTGMSGVTLGVGRNKTDDDVLPYVGIEFLKKSGSDVKVDDTLCVIYGEDESKLAEAVKKMKTAYEIADSAVTKSQMIKKEIS